MAGARESMCLVQFSRAPIICIDRCPVQDKNLLKFCCYHRRHVQSSAFFSLSYMVRTFIYIYIYTNTYISLLLHPFFANISPRTFLLSCTHTAYYKPFYSFFIDDIDTFIFKDANDIHDWFTSGALYYIFYHQQKFSTLLFPSKFSITRFHILLLEPIIKIFFSFYFPESKFYFYFRPVYSWSFCRNWRYY